MCCVRPYRHEAEVLDAVVGLVLVQVVDDVPRRDGLACGPPPDDMVFVGIATSVTLTGVAFRSRNKDVGAVSQS